MIPLICVNIKATHAGNPELFSSISSWDKTQQGVLKDAEWRWVVDQIYDRGDAKRICRLVQFEVKRSKSQVLRFDTFTQLLLSYQLSKHQRFIQPLVSSRVQRPFGAASAKTNVH